MGDSPSGLSGTLLAVLLVGLPAWVSAQPQPAAQILPLAHRSLLLDVETAGDRLVAVGERGHILLSDDYGRSWRQVAVPTRATLTAVTFVNERLGWAVGHDNIILHSSDAGESWRHQHPSGNPENRFLDVLFLDPQRGFAVGAYGLAKRTLDGGASWQRMDVSEDDFHFNRLCKGPDGRLYLACEGGDLLRSADEGDEWMLMDSPYEGSLFGVLALAGRTLLTYGLRGHVFRSTDAGNTWQEADVPVPVLITDAVRVASGQVVLAGQGEQFFISEDGGRTFRLWAVPVQAASALIEAADGSLIAVGLNGVWRLQVPRAPTPTTQRR